MKSYLTGVVLIFLMSSSVYAFEKINSFIVQEPESMIELTCNFRRGLRDGRGDMMDKVVFNIKHQTAILWMTKNNDGWIYKNRTKGEWKQVTSILEHKDGVIDGVGHDYFNASVFQFQPDNGRFTWIRIDKDKSYENIYNCWRVK